jgi:hypothetical protein
MNGLMEKILSRHLEAAADQRSVMSMQKNQFHTSSQKKGHRNRYDDADATDMVAAGYVNEDRDDNRDRPR